MSSGSAIIPVNSSGGSTLQRGSGLDLTCLANWYTFVVWYKKE